MSEQIRKIIKELKQALGNTSTNKLYEMALPSNKVHSYVVDLGYPIIEHLIKIILYPNNQERIKHWESEVKNWLKQCGKHTIKATNKPPTCKQLYSWIMEARANEYEMLYTIKDVQEKYGDVDYDLQDVINKIQSIVKHLVEHIPNQTISIDIIDTILKQQGVIK